MIDEKANISHEEFEELLKQATDETNPDRDEASSKIRSFYQFTGVKAILKRKTVLFEIATGVGKSRIALDAATEIGGTWLLVHSRISHKYNWEDEVIKWECDASITYTTYDSLSKHSGKKYTGIILDEAHHITPKRAKMLTQIQRDYNIMLSATVNADKRLLLQTCMPKWERFAISLSTAIEQGLLPKPSIILIPIPLPAKITAELSEIEKSIEIWKMRVALGEHWAVKVKLLPLGMKRKRLLASAKMEDLLEDYIVPILRDAGMRTVYFLVSVKQGTRLSSSALVSYRNHYLVNRSIVEDFNRGRMDELVAVDMLNESMNLDNLDACVILSLAGEATPNVQRFGRSLRSKNPLTILPYVVGTVDSRNVKKFIAPLRKYTTTMTPEEFSEFVNRNYG